MGDKKKGLILGIDEAGRGPLAGPVVCAAVSIPDDVVFPKSVIVDDSKKISPNQRKVAFEFIVRNLLWAVEVVDVYTIDRLNIRGATLSGMRAVVEKFFEKYSFLSCDFVRVMVDGKDEVSLPIEIYGECVPVIKGDSRVKEISCASIVAKVIRDSIMFGLDKLYPKYGFARHKGYPTKEHILALRRLGPCCVHRRSYRPVVQTQLW